MVDHHSSALPPLTLVLGGQRSGKSAYAESLFGADLGAVYVATGQALDTEMSTRIAAHRARRGGNWTTLEEPLDIARALINIDHQGAPVLLDSLAMWVANLLEAQKQVDVETISLVRALESIKSPVVVVSDEVGLGIIPDNRLARSFVDALGMVNQTIAASAQRVVLITAGLPQVLKG